MSSNISSGRIILGTATLMREGNEKERRRLLDRAYELGIRTFDTAPIYGFGKAETELGNFFRSGVSDVDVITKIGRSPSKLGARLSIAQRPIRWAASRMPAVRRVLRRGSGGVSVDAVPDAFVLRTQFQQSLDRLQGTPVHALLLHEVPWSSSWGDALAFMTEDALFSHVKHIGISAPAGLLDPYPPNVVRSHYLHTALSGWTTERATPNAFYSTLSTLRMRFDERQSIHPSLNWVSSNVAPSDLTYTLLAAAMRAFPQARMIIGTSKTVHLEELMYGLERASSIDIPWAGLIRDLGFTG